MVAVGYRTGNILTEWGTADFAMAFFSNIAFHLESSRWGSRFPALMNEFYMGDLPAEKVAIAREELAQIKNEFSAISPDKVIWNIEDLSQAPPWGNKIASTITDLSNYFVTSTGMDLIADFDEGLEWAETQGLSVQLEKSPLKGWNV